MTRAPASRGNRALTGAGWAAMAALLAAALFARFYHLTAKPFAHDESLFAYYSYCVYPLGNYRYDPLLHGPLLEHLTGGLFALLGPGGDSDFTARFWPALLGSLSVLLPWAFRRRIGRSGALAAAALMCFSPTLLYYSRFLRNDTLLLFFTLLFLLSFDRWIRRPRAAWPAFFTMLNAGLMVCVKENALFVFFTGATFLLFALGVDLAAGGWRRWRSSRSLGEALGLRRNRAHFRSAAPVAQASRLRSQVAQASRLRFQSSSSDNAAETPALQGLPPVARRKCARRNRGRWPQLSDGAELFRSLQIGIANGVAWVAAIFVIRQLIPALFPPTPELALALALLIALSWILLSILVHARRRPLGRDRYAGLFARRFAETWLALASGALIAVALYATLFTTLFRFRWGFFQIYRETLAYWWGQHMEHRLRGPFHYYVPRLMIYETAPLVLALGGAAALLLRRGKLLAAVVAGELLIVACVRLGLAAYPFDVAWADQHLHVAAPWQLYMAATVAWLALCLTARAILSRQCFHGWLTWWTAFSLLEYSYAGEKVPWIGVHIVGPLILLAGSEVGRLARWVAERKERHWPRVPAAAMVVVAGSLLFLRGARVAVEVSFERASDPGETLVYNHTMPETVEVAREIEQVARETGAGYDLKMTVEGEAVWPLIWYLRHYNRFSSPDKLESTNDAIIVEDEDKIEKAPRKFEEYIRRKVGLRQAWTPDDLDFSAMTLCALDAAGVRLGEEDADTTPTLQSTIETGRQEWAKAWRYFCKREPWLRPTETVLSVPVSFLYLRRMDTFTYDLGNIDSLPPPAPPPTGATGGATGGATAGATAGLPSVFPDQEAPEMPETPDTAEMPGAPEMPQTPDTAEPPATPEPPQTPEIIYPVETPVPLPILPPSEPSQPSAPALRPTPKS